MILLSTSQLWGKHSAVERQWCISYLGGAPHGSVYVQGELQPAALDAHIHERREGVDVPLDISLPARRVRRVVRGVE